VHVGQPEASGVGAGFVGGELDDHDLGRMAGEGGALVANAAAGVADALHGAVNVQLAAVGGRVGVLQLDEDVAEGLIRTGVLFVAGPEAVDVELDAFGGGQAEEHASERAVAEGQGLGHPRAGGLGIPEHGGRQCCGSLGRGLCGEGQVGEDEDHRG